MIRPKSLGIYGTTTDKHVCKQERDEEQQEGKQKKSN